MHKSILLTGTLLIALLSGMQSFAQNAPVIREPRSELDAMRMLLEKPVATYQDLADVIVASRGEFSKYTNFAARRQRVAELGVFSFDGIADPLTQPLIRGDLSLALHNTYDLDKGLLFLITSLGRYAHRDMQSMNIMDSRFSEMDNISGSTLVAVLDRADRVQEAKQRWSSPVTGAEEKEPKTE